MSISVEVVHNGTALRKVRHDHAWYSLAPTSGHYTVRIKNNTASRKLAVVSVDGVNVLGGEDASNAGGGYVLSAWETLHIPGWRRSNQSVAAFEFVPSEGSYAALTGRTGRNVGVIGVAVFEEKLRVTFPAYDCMKPRRALGPVRYGSVSSSSLNSCTHEDDFIACELIGDTVSLGSTSLNVGTGYGSEQSFHTVSTTFERASTAPSETVVLYYGVESRLKAWGLSKSSIRELKGESSHRSKHGEVSKPDPFPAGLSVPPPAGWRG